MVTTTEELIFSAVNSSAAKLNDYRLTKEDVENKTNRWYWQQKTNIVLQRMTIQKVTNAIGRVWAPDGEPGSAAYGASMNLLQQTADNVLAKEITKHRIAEESELSGSLDAGLDP